MAEIIDLAKYRRAKAWAAMKARLASGEKLAIPHPGGWWKYKI